MAGMRPFSPQQVADVLRAFRGPYRLRNRALYLLLLTTGFRLSEALSLRVHDVANNGTPRERITVAKAHMKGGLASRTIAAPPELRAAVRELVAWLQAHGFKAPLCHLFPNTRRGGPLTTCAAWRVLARAYRAAGIERGHGSHGCRKTFAVTILRETATGDHHADLKFVQRMLGHRSVDSTLHYLTFMQHDMEERVVHRAAAAMLSGTPTPVTRRRRRGRPATTPKE